MRDNLIEKLILCRVKDIIIKCESDSYLDNGANVCNIIDLGSYDSVDAKGINYYRIKNLQIYKNGYYRFNNFRLYLLSLDGDKEKVLSKIADKKYNKKSFTM